MVNSKKLGWISVRENSYKWNNSSSKNVNTYTFLKKLLKSKYKTFVMNFNKWDSSVFLSTKKKKIERNLTVYNQLIQWYN